MSCMRLPRSLSGPDYCCVCVQQLAIHRFTVRYLPTYSLLRAASAAADTLLLWLPRACGIMLPECNEEL